MPFDHFDWLAPLYERVIREFSDMEVLKTTLDLPVAGRILDVGGGTGRVSATLGETAAQMIVADLSLGMLRQTVSKPALLPVCTFSESLPFPNRTFARILMVDALHHVINQAATARELWRVLEPGGRLVVLEPDVRRFSVKLVALAEKLTLMRSHFLTPQKIGEIFSIDGARVKIQTIGYNAWIVVSK